MGRRLEAFPLEMINREMEEKQELLFVFFYADGLAPDAVFVVSSEDLREIEAKIWNKRNGFIAYYAVPEESAKKVGGQVLARKNVGRGKF